MKLYFGILTGIIGLSLQAHGMSIEQFHKLAQKNSGATTAQLIDAYDKLTYHVYKLLADNVLRVFRRTTIATLRAELQGKNQPNKAPKIIDPEEEALNDII